MHQMPDLIKIAITGPESTGKSWLAENLANYYKTKWVPEFAREYITKTGSRYSLSDIIYIAENQILSEVNLTKFCNRFLFADTEMLVCKIWSEVRFGTCPDIIKSYFDLQNYDLYLLCNIDLPWQYDPLREHPLMRRELFEMYHEELTRKNWNFRIISGTGQQRLKNATDFIDEIYSSE